MKRIVILGSSGAIPAMIEEIRRNDASCEITVVLFDQHYPYRRDDFPGFITKKISLEEVFCQSKEFYNKHKVDVLCNMKISSINFRRKRITTDNKMVIDYDSLIITEAPDDRFPSIKGVKKEGVLGYKKLGGIESMVNRLMLIDAIVIQSDSFAGLAAAFAFAKRDKEVLLVSSSRGFLARCVCRDAASVIVDQLAGMGVRVIQDSTIVEILGDKDVKAVRVESGKVFSAQAVIFAESDSDTRLFSGLKCTDHGQIVVDKDFKTSVEDVFAVDQIDEGSHITRQSIVSGNLVSGERLDSEGNVVAGAINGQELALANTVPSSSLAEDQFNVTVIGKVDGTSVHWVPQQESGKFVGLYTENDITIGVVLINAQQEQGKYLEYIRSGKNIEQIEEVNLVGSLNAHSAIGSLNGLDDSIEPVDN